MHAFHTAEMKMVVVWLQGVTPQRGGERCVLSRSCLLVRSGRENANSRKMGVGHAAVDLGGIVSERGEAGLQGRDGRGLVVERRQWAG